MRAQMHAEGISIREFHVHDAAPMYVQRITAGASSHKGSALLIHGGGHSGMCWTSCPDDRAGWALHLAHHGWTAYVIDWPGIGRSPRKSDYLTMGLGPLLAALGELLEEIGTAVIIGHSIGGALASMIARRAPNLVAGLLLIAPIAPSRGMGSQPIYPENEPIVFSDEMIMQHFANGRRFPSSALSAYKRSIGDLSPSIINALGGHREPAYRFDETIKAAAFPTLVLAGDQDQLCQEPESRYVANRLGATYLLTGSEGTSGGFGHMIPIERDSEHLLAAALDHLGLPL